MKAITVLVMIFIFYLSTDKIIAIKNSSEKSKDSILLAKTVKLQNIILKFPTNFNLNKKYPLLVILHGNGGNANEMSQVFSSFDKEEMILAFPQGAYETNYSGIKGYSWYYLTNNKKIWEKADLYVSENIYEIIIQLNKKYKIDKTFVLGFSQGAALAYQTALKSPDCLTGIIAIAGELPQIDSEGSLLTAKDIENARNLKILIARGRTDKLIKKENVENQYNFFKKNKYHVEFFEYDGGHFFTEPILEKIIDWIDTNMK